MEVKDLCKDSKMQMAITTLANKIIKYVKSAPIKTKMSQEVVGICFLFCIIH